VVLVDIDPHLARARRQVSKILTPDKRPPSRKGLGGAGLQHRFREGYRQLAARDPERWAVIENDQALEIGVERITSLISESLVHGVPRAMARRPARARPAPPPLTSTSEALTSFLRWIDERASGEPSVAAYFLTGIWGPGIDERRQALAERATDTMITGLAGLDDEVSWQLRDRFAARSPQRVARSLSAIPGIHPRALPLRRALRAAAPAEVLLSLDFLDDDEAWRLRDELAPAAPELAAASTMRIGTARAWALRERWLADRGGLPALAEYETARLMCKAVSGLDDDRAWELRKAAREAAPIAALASLTYLGSDRAFRWREKWAQRAPKAIFNSLRRSDDPRAWELRERMAASCKEAIDSIQDLDGPRAWALRERCADVWPSTVVKSLGPLADGPRGRELTERQLKKYPGNVSLLKHAAAIAVGAHVTVGEDA
jgi:dTMP kinase